MSPVDPAVIDDVLRELDTYRSAHRAAFEEGFALSKFGGPIDTAWERSEARNSDWSFALTRISVGSIVRRLQEICACCAEDAIGPGPHLQCTRIAGHDGAHVAHGPEGLELRRWANSPSLPTTRELTGSEPEITDGQSTAAYIDAIRGDA